MTFKYIFALTFAAVASAGILPPEHPIHEYTQEQPHYQPPASQPAHQHAALAPVYQLNIQAPQQQHVLVQKQLHKPAEQQYEDDAHPQYNFSYDVQDAISGDSKSQTESRDGDVVHGEYSLNDADGFRRIVKYTASDANGFNAVVHREPLQHKVVAATASAPVHHYQHAAPASYADNNAAANHVHHANYATYAVPQQSAHDSYHQHH